MFVIAIELEVPDVVLKPQMDEVLECIVTISQQLQAATRHIYAWGEDRSVLKKQRIVNDEEVWAFLHCLSHTQALIAGGE